MRPQVAETVARGQLHEDSYFYTGLTNGQEGSTIPFPVTMEVLQRGQERYNIYCSACHSRVGNGVGMIVQRGYSKAANFHTARMQAAPLGHFFQVITNGYGAMPDYSAQLTPADRWAVVAYIKALQLSQNATQADIPAGEHAQPLTDIAVSEGLPSGFASDWVLPPTAVTYGTPNDQSRTVILVTPVQAPASETGAHRQPLGPQQQYAPAAAGQTASPHYSRKYSEQKGLETAWHQDTNIHGEAGGHGEHHGPRALPASLYSPEILATWRTLR